MLEATIPSLAKAIAEWFPELEGRSIAVSEVEPFSDKTNVPTLPLAVVALVTENNSTPSSNGATRITIEDDILVQFIFKPVKYNREGGAETPFFAFYDYEAIRDKLLAGLKNWRTPRQGSIGFRSLDVESDEFAVYIAIRLRTSENWCKPDADTKPCDMLVPAPIISIKARMYEPPGRCTDVEPCPTPEDPCHAARLRNPYGNEAKAAEED